MPLPHKKSNQKWTYADYLTWDDGQRWELIEGDAYCMSPAPGLAHQRVSRILTRMIDNGLIGKRCELFAAPFDVRLSGQCQTSDNCVDTVVQPDISVICDRSKLDERGCNGVPDLVIEILSSSTAAYDIKTKYDLYERFGVREYWLIHPIDRTLLVHKLGDYGRYAVADRYAGGDKVVVGILPEIVIDLAEVFSEE